jgi:hypothetical protein
MTRVSNALSFHAWSHAVRRDGEDIKGDDTGSYAAAQKMVWLFKQNY